MVNKLPHPESELEHKFLVMGSENLARPECKFGGLKRPKGLIYEDVRGKAWWDSDPLTWKYSFFQVVEGIWNFDVRKTSVGFLVPLLM